MFYYLAIVAGVCAYQILVRCATSLLMNDMTAPSNQNKSTHIANIVLSLGSAAGFIWFGTMPLFVGLTLVTVIIEALFLIANK